MNTGILVSGFRPEFNLIVKAGMIILILLIQSPLAARIAPPRLHPVRKVPAE
jgi:galactofuranose transport system permease protein